MTIGDADTLLFPGGVVNFLMNSDILSEAKNLLF